MATAKETLSKELGQRLPLGCPNSPRTFKALDLQSDVARGGLKCGAAAEDAGRTVGEITGIVVHSTRTPRGKHPSILSALVTGLAGITYDEKNRPQGPFQAHYYIGTDGAVYRLVAEDCIANHAKGSDPLTGKRYNNTTIGVELFQEYTKATDTWEPITSAQYESLRELTSGLNNQYGNLNVMLHSVIDTEVKNGKKRKVDPFNFDMTEIAVPGECNLNE